MEKVTAYFQTMVANPDREDTKNPLVPGFQKFLMDRIDFDEAVRPRTITCVDGTMMKIPGSTEWTLEVPAGAIIENKIPLSIVVERQEPVSVPVMPTASPQPLKRKLTARAG